VIINRQLLWTLDDDHLLLLLFAFAHFWINNVFLLIFFFVLGCFVLCVGLSLVRRVQLLLNILLLWALFCFLLHKTIPHWLLNLEIMLFVVNFISKFTKQNLPFQQIQIFPSKKTEPLFFTTIPFLHLKQ